MNKRLKNFVTNSFQKVASDLAKDPSKLSEKLNSAKEKLNKQSVSNALGSYTGDLKVLIRLIKSWIKGDYKEISYQTIIWSIVGIIYFLNPTDFVPDFIIGLGLLDDIAVLRWIFKQYKKDIEKYKNWETNQSKEF